MLNFIYEMNYGNIDTLNEIMTDLVLVARCACTENRSESLTGM